MTSVSQLLSAAIMVTLALRASGPVDTRTIVGGPVLASALAAGTMALLHDEILIAAPAGALVYVVVLALFERRFHPHDYERVMRFVRRRPAEPSAGGAPESEPASGLVAGRRGAAGRGCAAPPHAATARGPS